MKPPQVVSSSALSVSFYGLGLSRNPIWMEHPSSLPDMEMGGTSLNQASGSTAVGMGPAVLGSVTCIERTNYKINYHLDIANIQQYQGEHSTRFSRHYPNRCPVCWLMVRSAWESHPWPCPHLGINIVSVVGALKLENVPARSGFCYIYSVNLVSDSEP